MVETVLAQSCELLRASHGCIYQCAPDGSALELRLATGLFQPGQVDPAPGRDLVREVCRRGHPLLVEDYRAWPGRKGVVGDIRSMLAAPLESEGRVVGVVGLAHDLGSDRTFAHADEEILGRFAQLAGIALDNARLYAEERRSHEEAERLRAATLALSASLDLQEVLVRILTELRKVVPHDSASVQELRGTRLEVIGGHGFTNLPEILGLSFDISSTDYPNHEVARRRAPVIVADAPASYPLFDAVPHAKAGIRSFLGVPLLFGDRLIGMLALDSKQVGYFTEHHAQLALAFAAQAAIAIQNARLHAEAQAEIAERKRAEARLEESQTLLRTIIESEPECVKLVAADGTLLQMNPAGLAMIEADSLEQVLGAPLSRLVLPPWRSAFGALIRAVFGGETGALEFEIEGLKGGRRWLDTRAVPLRNPKGEIVALLGVTRDVTARKQAEQALRERDEQLRQAHKIEAVGRLAGGVAHDFNNLLNVIMGYCELLLRDLAPGTQARGRLDQILRAADRAASLTRQLLAFSRRQVLQPRMLALNAVVLDTESMIRRLIGEDIQVVTVAGTAIGQVKADPGQIEQVLMNLAVNARDAMPRGGSLTIETKRADLCPDDPRRPAWLPAGAYVMLAVTDTGMGMDADTLTHLFEPFFTTKEQGKGTGLGLATVYGIVKQSGGYVLVESELGRGSSFRIYLPRVDEGTPAPEAWAAAVPAARGSETVLVVEDEPALLDFVRELLRESGYTALPARTVGEAARLCESHPGPIDLLLTDLVMPDMSGPELAARLAPVRPQMKVLFMSGYTDDALGPHGMLDPGVALLQKPFTAEALTHKIREVLTPRA
ncbi:MAG TPA: GAF domain-containing protein [Vicinamibacteria bacterium]|nr:GAF domain-containing protein [Vicinamibacteria bacterium]